MYGAPVLAADGVEYPIVGGDSGHTVTLVAARGDDHRRVVTARRCRLTGLAVVHQDDLTHLRERREN